jgi:DNA-directed RNA polymerase specialized sigma24 family protein
MAGDRKSDLLGCNDPRLAPLICADGEEAWQSALERLLVGHVRPLIDAILRRGRYSAIDTDREDVAATIVLRLIRRLQNIALREEDAIVVLDDFVARLTANAVCDVMRRRSPERTRLKNRIRYVVSHDPRFAGYPDAGNAIGLASWPAPRFTVEPLSRDEAPVVRADRRQTAEAIHSILRQVGRAVLIDDLVRILAERWGIQDVRIETREIGTAEPAIRIEARQYLGVVWSEVCELPPHQRAALLLNLRDPDYRNAIVLFVMTGIASAERIAEVLGMTPEALAAIWNDLPLDDLAIADMLGVGRQQVINYRRSARERLNRRMKRNL